MTTRMTIRILAALAVLVSAIVHLYLWFDGVKDQGTVGALFVVNVIAGIAIAVLLVTWRNWEPLFLAAGFGAATIVAFLIAVTGGLFGIKTDWSWYAYLAFAVEVVAIVLGAAGLQLEGHLDQVRHAGAGGPRREHGLGVRPR